MDLTDVLSVEALGLIFELLTPEEVFRVRCVCRSWRHAAENVVHRRFRRDGPFIALQDDEVVPLDLTLPVLELQHKVKLAHPAIARSTFGRPRALTMAPVARAKLKTLCPAARYIDAPPAMLLRGGAAFPHVDFLDLCDLQLPKKFVWPQVGFVKVTATPMPDVVRRMPNCHSLWLVELNREKTRTVLAGFRHLVYLSVTTCEISASDVPRSLAHLLMYHVNLLGHRVPASSHPVTLTATGVVQMECDLLRLLAQHPFVLDLPALQCLEVSFPSDTAGRVAIMAPSLRILKLHNGKTPVYIDAARRMLEVVHVGAYDFAPGDNTSLAWLAGQPLRELVLSSIPNDDLAAFLASTLVACCEKLEILRLHGMIVVTFLRPIPFSLMPRLQELVLCNCRLSNYEDLVHVPGLKRLILRDLADLSDVAWLRDLGALKSLTLSGMSNLMSLDGVQHAAALEELDLNSVRQGLCLTPVAQARRLRRLTLSIVWIDWMGGALDLADSPVTELSLAEFYGNPENLRLPTRLRRCTIQASGSEHWRLLGVCSGLPNLRRLHVDGPAPVHHSVLPPLPTLKVLTMEVNGLECGALAGAQNVEFLRLKLYSARSLDFQGICAASITLLIEWPKEGFSLGDFVDPATLRHLHLKLHRLQEPLALAPLAACERLEELTLGVDNLTSLEPLRAKPALREVRIKGGYNKWTALDAAALLTCPRLLVVDIQNYTLLAGQEAALHAHLETRLP